MVAVVVSQRKCAQCAHLLEGFLSIHVCSACGFPQPVSSSEDYFSALGMPRKFSLDRQELEKRFYEISRLLHPDRFTTSHSDAMSLSLKRMSFLNQAYGTLKAPVRLREYFLTLEGIQVSSTGKTVGGKTTMPIELAEAWFEIQDLWMDDPHNAQKKLIEFEIELNRLKRDAERNLISFEAEYDLHPSSQILERLAQEIQSQSYLKSIEKDVERIKKNANSN